MIQEVFAQSKAFFDLDIETKMSVESDKNNRGYRPMGSEKINRANQVKGDTKVRVLKLVFQAFSCFRRRTSSSSRHYLLFGYPNIFLNSLSSCPQELFELFRDIDPDSEEASKPLRGPNQWPPESLVPG